MNYARTFFAFTLCLCISVSHAQDGAEQRKGMFSFGINLSDYNLVKLAKDSSLNYALHHNKLFKPGTANFGFEADYWRHLIPHVDFSGSLGGTFSNFPALFVKDDSIGQAAFSVYADGLIHLKAFENNPLVNPFLTAGLGGGYFGKQAVLYAPLGLGFAFDFKDGGSILLQMQIRKALSAGITNDFMFYSVAFAHAMPGTVVRKHKRYKKGKIQNPVSSISVKNETEEPGNVKEKETTKNVPRPAADTALLKNEIPKMQPPVIVQQHIVVPSPDADGDGIPDKDDRCPTVKGSAKYQGCPFPLIEDAILLKMSPDSATYMIYFDFDQSTLHSEAFAVLYQIMELLKSDTTLTISIAGYADSKGSYSKNMQVSAERAQVTRDYFLSYDIDPSRIKWSYYGSSNPIDNVLQWRNRRVEITIIKKRDSKSASP